MNDNIQRMESRLIDAVTAELIKGKAECFLENKLEVIRTLESLEGAVSQNKVDEIKMLSDKLERLYQEYLRWNLVSGIKGSVLELIECQNTLSEHEIAAIVEVAEKGELLHRIKRICEEANISTVLDTSGAQVALRIMLREVGAEKSETNK